MHPSLQLTHFRTLSFLLVLAVGALGTATCEHSPIGNRQGGATTANRNVSSEAPGSAPIPMATLSTGERIGVPECDEFLYNYEACVIQKVPESTQARHWASIEEMRRSWLKLAANPATKATLAQACKRSADQTREAMKAYNCSF